MKYNRDKRQDTRDKVYAVILVGGKGKRLKPLSTDRLPKAFLSITKDRKTMFRKTVDRIRKIIPQKNILVVANKAHSRLVKRDFPGIIRGNLLLEPVSRNTAPAIYLAAKVIYGICKDAVMAVIPTDQYVRDEKKYLSAIKDGIRFAKNNNNAILALGIKPTFPSTEFGYIRVKGQGSGVKGVYKVEKFTEKPDLKTATKYIRSGKYLWNAGAFIFNVEALLNAVRRFCPDISDGLLDLSRLNERYPGLPDISIDYAIMEKAENIYCVKGSYRWQDMGSFASLISILKMESRDFIMRNGKVVKIL